MLHIRHIFLHPSLSDSNLPFGNYLNAHIMLKFRRLQGVAYVPRAKIAARRVEIENLAGHITQVCQQFSEFGFY